MVQVADLNVIPQRFLVIAYGVRVDAVLARVLIAFVSLGGLAAVHPAAAIGHCLRLARLATAGFGSAVCHWLPRRGLHGVFRGAGLTWKNRLASGQPGGSTSNSEQQGIT